MAWSQSDIDALKAAIATGVLTVAYADRTVQYRSLAEMTTILSMMLSEVLGPVLTGGYRLAATRKGV